MNKMQKLSALLTAGILLHSSALAWENGVYRDKAEGFGGEVILTVTVRDEKIESLVTESTGGEKSEYYLKAEEALTQAIIDANGIDGVDTVAGATGTSESILAAMQGILEQARYKGVESSGDREPVVSIKEPSMTAEPYPVV